jgi:hypothetical protein
VRTVTESPTTGTVVTGASDDLVEISGDLCEELDALDCNDGTMAFSDGTLLGVEYDKDGIWRFKVIFKGSCFDHKVEGCVNDDDGTNDVVHFKAGLLWATFAEDVDVISK